MQSAPTRSTSSHPDTELSRDRAPLALPDTSPLYGSAPAAIGGREVAAISARPDDAAEIVVCIPAFRRPAQLRATLDSLARQATARRFAVVIAENDARSRASVAEAQRFLAQAPISGLCVVEPRQGNCHAINAAFETARAVFPRAFAFLMIDDDEIAAPDWLERMVAAAIRNGADIVGGPVYPRFSKGSERLASHPAFCPAYAATGPVPVIYGSGNCLIRREVFERLADPAFDVRFNFLGGGDTDFFARARAAGARFFWMAEAVINETVPPERTRVSWIARRGLRTGAINFHVQRSLARTPTAKLRLACKLALQPPVAVLRAAAALLRREGALRALHPVLIALGGMLAVIGIEPQQYRARSPR